MAAVLFGRPDFCPFKVPLKKKREKKVRFYIMLLHFYKVNVITNKSVLITGMWCVTFPKMPCFP